MSQFLPTCLGVTLPAAAVPPPGPGGAGAGGPTVADAFDAINASLDAAIAKSRTRIRADRRPSPSPAGGGAALVPAPAASTPVRVFSDCALPMVNQFPQYLANLHDEVSSSNMPVVGFSSDSNFGRNTVAPLWNPPSGLFGGVVRAFQVVLNGDSFLNDYYDHINYLTRLDSGDDIWQQGGQAAAWYNQYAGGLKTYLTDLFAGNFVDRNGTAVPLAGASLLTNPFGVDVKQVSPQLAGGILSALVEFLGDQYYQVPFYSADILKSYRDQRDDGGSQKTTTDQFTKLTAAAKAGSISAADAKDLLGIIDTGTGAALPILFDLLVPGTDSPIASSLTRQVVARLSQLDAQILSQLAAAQAAAAQATAIAAKASPLLSKFTCFQAGTITANLQCIFLVDGVTGATQGTCAGNKDAGRSIGAGVTTPDLADLVGKFVAYAGTSAEKSVRSIVGGLVRGVSIASLQNEVIAEVLGAIAGTLSRKLVESLTYQGLIDTIQSPNNGITAPVKLQALQLLAKAVRLPS